MRTQAQLISDTKPIASRTLEAHLVLDGNTNESASKRLSVKRGINIVGVKITISANGAPNPALRRPTLDDVMVRLSSQDLPLAATSDEDTEIGREKYATASALDISSRYMFADLEGAPDITVQARWKNADNTVAIYQDSLVSVALLFDYTEPGR